MSAQWPAPAPRPTDPPVAAADPLVQPAYEPGHERESLPGLPEPPTPLWKKLGGWAVAIGLLALKFGKGLFILLKGAKIFTTAGTMLVSIVAYSIFWGWKFAVGFVLLLLVHEMGHVIQLRREGIPASAPMFIPFLGAVVMAKSLGENATAEARVGLAGPVLGTLGALALLPLGLNATDPYWHDFWFALVFTGLFLNLFNLLPVVPLDGGRAMAALSPKMWFVGFAGLVFLTFVFPNPIMFLILLFGGYETYKRWKARRSGDEAVRAYYRVKPSHRVMVAAVYLALILVCVVGMDLTHIQRDIP